MQTSHQTRSTPAAPYDEVHHVQAAFRAIMTALAEPGTVSAVTPAHAAPPEFGDAMAAVALALCDHETPVWLDGHLSQSRETIEWLRFHTGAQLTERPAEAAFAFVQDAQAMPPLMTFAQGSLEYPDRSTTIVIAITNIGIKQGFKISGPGINGTSRINPLGLPQSIIGQLAGNRARFPCGIDLLLCAGARIAGLPRTTVLSI